MITHGLSVLEEKMSAGASAGVEEDLCYACTRALCRLVRNKDLAVLTIDHCLPLLMQFKNKSAQIQVYLPAFPVEHKIRSMISFKCIETNLLYSLKNCRTPLSKPPWFCDFATMEPWLFSHQTYNIEIFFICGLCTIRTFMFMFQRCLAEILTHLVSHTDYTRACVIEAGCIKVAIHLIVHA